MPFFNVKMWFIAAGIFAICAALWWFADIVGDARELNVKTEIEKQEGRHDAAETKGRNRARDCHALGADRLWNVRTEQCDKL